jgi:hypothetical protein
LANLLPRDRATVATSDSPCSWAFNDGICEAQFSALGGSPTVSARFRYTTCEGQFYWQNVHGNSIQKSASRWWLVGKFLEGSTKVPRLKARPWLGYKAMIMHSSTTATPKMSSHRPACFAAHFGQCAYRPKRPVLKICQHLLHCTMSVAFPTRS